MDKNLQKELLQHAYNIALSSPDPSTQNGAFLYDPNKSDSGLCPAVNEFPVGVEYKPERFERPLKYKVIEHAERNSLFMAATNGIATRGLTMVACWAACTDCSRAIIQCGIKTLLTHKQAGDKSPPMWADEIKISMEMFNEAGVEVILYDGKIFDNDELKLLHSGKIWSP